MYSKPDYWLIMKGMYIDKTSRNVHGQNITKVRQCKVYTKQVVRTSVHKTSLLRMVYSGVQLCIVEYSGVQWCTVCVQCVYSGVPRNVHGWNITKVRQCEVYTKQVVCTSVHKTSLLTVVYSGL